MVNPMQQYNRMPMPPRMPYPYGGYGYWGQNRNNMLRNMLLMQMMRNGSNAGGPSYAGGHQETRQQSSSYGGGGRGRYAAAKRRVAKRPVKKKNDDDNTEEDSPTFVNGYTGIMNQSTGVIPSEGKIFSDMKKVSLNEQQLKNFVAESAIKVVKRYITEAYGDNDGYLLLDDDDDITNDDMAAPQDNKDYKRLQKIIQTSFPDSIYIDNGEYVVTTEWLVGTFAGVGFRDKNLTRALEKMCAYLNRHIGHDSLVGKIVTKSGWPDLQKVEQYLSED